MQECTHFDVFHKFRGENICSTLSTQLPTLEDKEMAAVASLVRS
jgi:hypothetical protein